MERECPARVLTSNVCWSHYRGYITLLLTRRDPAAGATASRPSRLQPLDLTWTGRVHIARAGAGRCRGADNLCHHVGIRIDQHNPVRKLDEEIALRFGNLVRHVIGHGLGGQRRRGLRSYLPLITGGGLRLLASEPLCSLPLLRLVQVKFFLHIARCVLRGTEADTAAHRTCECTGAKWRLHDLLHC